MSFSSLPPELVHQIIESTVPHSFHTTTYKARQDTLRRLSLVSRQFRSIAQPLLLELAWLDQNDQLKGILGDESTVTSRELVLKVGSRLQSDFVVETIGGSSNLRKLTIQSDNGDVFDLSVLSSCENLVNLQLSGDCFDATSLDSLPSLLALSLNFQAAQAVHELLDPRRVPTLRALGLENIDESHELRDLESTRINELLPQLDALCIGSDLYDLAKDTLLDKLAPRILIDALRLGWSLSLTEEALSTIQHLRIEPQPYLRGSGRSAAIHALVQILESDQHSKPSQLRSIYFDPDVRPVLFDGEEVHEEFDKLEERCREAGIDLVFEAQARDYELDSYVSGEFSRRQRKSRQKAQLVEV
ncbi:hypothetical protein JCM5350_000173 [Sporobolomyces pararoseus]